MNLNDKLSKLSIISSIGIILNFFFTEMTVTNIVLTLIALGAIIGYYVIISKNNNQVDKKINKLEEEISDTSRVYKRFMNEISKFDGIFNSEEIKMSSIKSTLENTNGMVVRNKENTRQAAQLAEVAQSAAIKGKEEMNNMMRSIDEIKSLSDEIRKIIKVIDDIAFQTNILALNAAVEAARAGEAGKGFAVVADEVRSLAQKSAEAVKNTSEIISKNVKSAENGVETSQKVEESLNGINSEIGKVTELINEIMASSEEQADEVARTKDIVLTLDELVQDTLSVNVNCVSMDREVDNKLNTVGDIVNAIISGSNSNLNTKDENLDFDVNQDFKIKNPKMPALDRTPIIKPKNEPLNIKKAVRNDVSKDDNVPLDIDTPSINVDNHPMRMSSSKNDAEMILPLDDSDGF